MVDAFVSFAVNKLGDFLIQEVGLRLSLRDDIQWLINELRFMKSFLTYAEEKQSEDQRIQQWVFEINSVANDAVAILETYSLEVGEANVDGFSSRLKACACICKKEIKFYNVGKEIQSLKQRIMDISRKRETYGFKSIDNIAGEGPSSRPNNQSDLVRTLRRTSSYVDDHDHIFVGLQDVVERLLAELLKEEPHRSVISIYGMGGLGKTTLARNLYTSPNIVSSFPKRAWICVSQEYNIIDLLRNIIKSIQGRSKENLDLLEKMTEEDLESHLRGLLKENKYLVVVDDVWHREAWERLKRSFPDSKNGSRVIITTRKEDVAERADDRGFVHKLRFLSEEESWDLFCRKLLDVPAMVSTMERLAKDMVDKCGGLPLAIVVLSGLLSHKRRLEEWQKVKAHLWQNIKDDSIEISCILSLSYNDLPTVLKQCFLYFGMFPEDNIIIARDILRLWMAEGFIPRGEERIEDVAEGFLNELIRRSLIQVDLVNLRELRMDNIKTSYSLNNLSSLENLNTLRLNCEHNESFPDLAYLSSCQKLQKLLLGGRIEKLPLSDPFPNSITIMYLFSSKFMEDPMPILGKLPNLRILNLVAAYEGKEITCSDNSFSQLEFLQLNNLQNLERWHLATSAMPLIKGLGIEACPKLKEIPERMKDVKRIPIG